MFPVNPSFLVEVSGTWCHSDPGVWLRQKVGLFRGVKGCSERVKCSRYHKIPRDADFSSKLVNLLTKVGGDTTQVKGAGAPLIEQETTSRLWRHLRLSRFTYYDLRHMLSQQFKIGAAGTCHVGFPVGRGSRWDSPFILPLDSAAWAAVNQVVGRSAQPVHH